MWEDGSKYVNKSFVDNDLQYVLKVFANQQLKLNCK